LAYDYLIKNFPNSQLIPTAKIGYANTLEASIIEKYSAKTELWKPYTKPEVVNREDFLSIIKAYDQLAQQYKNNAIYPQALFNMANVYAEHLLNFKKADSLYSIINQYHSVSNYSQLAFIQRGKIAILNNDLDNAKLFFTNAVSLSRGEPDETAEAYFYLSRIDFWLGNFTQSLKQFQSVTKNLSTDFANDALELSSLISASKRDSLNLYKYAQGDLFAIQNKFKEAANEFKTLADNPNLFILNEFANYKLSQMLIADDDLPTAIKILEVLSENTKYEIFADKSLFLLAQTYRYGIKDVYKAIQNYEKLLEKFPDSLYFDRARDSLKELQTNNG
jgi:tetratricopeptide (TPR) repeat protein